MSDNATNARRHELATKDEPFRYFVGWDSHEQIAHQLACFSAEYHSSVPIKVRC